MVSVRALVLALTICSCAAYLPLPSVNKFALSASFPDRTAIQCSQHRKRSQSGLTGLRLSGSEDKGTARAVGERDSGRHLDDSAERVKAVSDLYTPFWNYAAEVRSICSVVQIFFFVLMLFSCLQRYCKSASGQI